MNYLIESFNSEINELVFYINNVFNKTNYSRKHLLTNERIEKIIKNRTLQNGTSFEEELKFITNEWKEIYQLKCN